MSRPVLMIEDHDPDAELHQRLLLRAGDWQPLRVSSLIAAMSWGEPKPDAIMLNLRLSDGGDPGKLCRDIVERFERSAVVLVTGIDDSALAYRMLASGAQEVLIKGMFDAPRLDQVLQAAIARKQGELQAVVRKLEESRTDMKVGPQLVADVVKSVVERDVMPKLRKLAPDTDVYDIVKVSPWDDLRRWASKHPVFAKWLPTVTMVAATAYAAVQQLVEAIERTDETVQQMNDKLDQHIREHGS